MTGSVVPSPKDDEADTPLVPVVEMLRLLARAIRAHQLYLPNNPMHARALDAARGAIAAIWEYTDLLQITVTETEFLSEGRVALEELDRGGESLPWLFYKDGIRTLTLRPGFEGEDLETLLDVLQLARTRTLDDGDDLLTLLWECDFAHLTYEYVELGPDGPGAPGAELLRGGAPVGSITPPGEVEREEVAAAQGAPPSAEPSAFASIQDFDSTLYFLDEQEIEYLQRAIQEEFAVDLRCSVAAALLDTFEQEDEPAVREEICGILDHFLLALLSNTEFRASAYLLREAAAAVERSVSLVPEHQQRLLELADRMSEPTVLTQLLESLEDMPLKPPPDDLNELFMQLKGTALAPLLHQLARTQNADLHALLEGAVMRLAMRHTGELVQLILSTDEEVAVEAIRRAGALRSPAAVAPLSRVLGEGTDDIRRAAVSALVDVGSAGAMQVLERAVEDDNRDIRIAAVKAIADRQHRAALARVERALKERVLPDDNPGEKSAFFDAYAMLAGDKSVSFLEGILSPKGFIIRREDPLTRAAAATALGKLGTPRAVEVLQRASNDKEIVVRTAAARALRGSG